MNKVVKSALRKVMATAPSSFWDDLLPSIQLGINLAVSGTHQYTPFEVLFKQAGVPPGVGHVEFPPAELSEEDMGDIVDALVERALGLNKEVVTRLGKQDKRMVEQYHRSVAEEAYVFESGDKVWLK